MLKPRKGLPWMWTRAGLRPEFARLMARPILVLSFDKFGRSPIDYAKKTTAVVTGSSWVSSPFGPAMYFPNTSGAGTDYLTFPRSAYPSSSAETVPHSIAVLWCPTAAAPFDEQNPFQTATSGNGVRVTAGSGGFQIIHGGVAAFAAIGAALYANTQYVLQLYSYDLVTLNQLVVNLKTGAIASQSIAETRALTAANGPQVGVFGASEVLCGSVAGLAWVRGAWTINEMEMIARNPTALWTPDERRRRIAYKAPASTAYTLPAASGSYTLTGQPVTLRVTRQLPVAQGSYALTGQAVGLKRGLMLAATAGAYALAGQSVALRTARQIALAAGSYTLNGRDVALLYNGTAKSLAVGTGTFVLTGQVIALRVARQLGLAPGAYTLTGRDVTFSSSTPVVAEWVVSGPFTDVGPRATLTDVAPRITLRAVTPTALSSPVEFP